MTPHDESRCLDETDTPGQPPSLPKTGTVARHRRLTSLVNNHGSAQTCGSFRPMEDVRIAMVF